MGRFHKATREQLRLRMAIDGPSGSGKTYSALSFALALGQRVAVIDTEHRSASKYQGLVVDGIPWDFFVTELTNFSPTEYTAAIKEAGREDFDVLVIDSLSHAWSGEGGALELKDKQGGNSFAAWKEITPMHNRMVEAILKSPCHVLVTMRSKTDIILEPDERGRMVPRKIGMAPIQRPGMEYEFDVYCQMDWTHTLKVTKSRCPATTDLVAVKPGPSFMLPIIEWLNTGVRPELEGKEAPKRREPITVDSMRTLKSCHEALAKAGLTAAEWKAMLAPFGAAGAKELAEDDAQELLGQCYQRLAEVAPSKAAPVESNGSANGHAPAMCSGEQMGMLDTLFFALQYDAARICKGIKSLYGIDRQDVGETVKSLTTQQADDLIAKLQAKQDGQRQPAQKG